ncbi:CDP-glycerol glycerophosphotransferase family protein [Microbacterium sp. CFBP 8794]|uniref:CDP-glycerol glycerophosphotransferase family protein n=1 Tax=Microbacterium sp. CFBP 8794 TaxID=2775269 RepID=UPI00178260F0|nr:CDP-glycerol glycerophosphotransferase family protein [Microbacterium sp. CFBP 8794]MBD8477875.1 CDP-glycerol glycerophosphotransferase family protein [Microbacterium sp. CFBP 8794]
MTEARFFDDDGTPALELSGTGARPASVDLVGARVRSTGRLHGRGRTWRAVIPLRAARWGGSALPLPSGRYRVRIDADGAPDAAPPATTLPEVALPGLRAALSDGTVVISPPGDPADRTPAGQAALERRYARERDPLENAVFFESFYGRTAGCNPLAIDRELARVAPGVTRYWSVVDHSVDVPAGAVAVVEGSPEWWRARGVSRLLVVNDWLRRRFVRRRGQVVLQTWHGTPLKRLALHRPGFDPRRALAVLRESRRWNVLLAQSPYAARVLTRAYAFLRRPVWIEGYPRNDALRTDDGALTRRRLGIGPDERVLLYAPTWRDDREAMVDFVDPAALARAADAVVLVRGHTRTLQPGRDADGARVIDVTGYPDTSRLLAVADALITDYSSVMFDFSVTGKPLYFLVPDLEHYRGELRGFYFDLLDAAPGPVVRTQHELERALAEVDPDVFTERYARWQREFTARDDGHAAERVVARILDQGFVDRA